MPRRFTPRNDIFGLFGQALFIKKCILKPINISDLYLRCIELIDISIDKTATGLPSMSDLDKIVYFIFQKAETCLSISQLSELIIKLLNLVEIGITFKIPFHTSDNVDDSDENNIVSIEKYIYHYDVEEEDSQFLELKIKVIEEFNKVLSEDNILILKIIVDNIDFNSDDLFDRKKLMKVLKDEFGRKKSTVYKMIDKFRKNVSMIQMKYSLSLDFLFGCFRELRSRI